MFKQSLQSVLVVLVLTFMVASSVVSFENSNSGTTHFLVPCAEIPDCGNFTKCVDNTCRCAYGTDAYPDCKNECEAKQLADSAPCDLLIKNCIPIEGTGAATCVCKFGSVEDEGSPKCVNPCEGVTCDNIYTECIPLTFNETACHCKWGDVSSNPCKNECDGKNPCNIAHETCTVPVNSTGEGVCLCNYGGDAGESCVSPCDNPEITKKCGPFFDCTPLADGTANINCSCKWGEEDDNYKPPECKSECDVNALAACGPYSKCSSNATGYARCVCIRGTSRPPNCKDECVVKNPCDVKTEECTPTGELGNATCSCIYGSDDNGCKSPPGKAADSAGDVNKFIVNFMILVLFSVVIC